MKKFKSRSFAMLVLISIFSTSVQASISFLKLSSNLQKLYQTWFQESGTIVYPIIGYKYKNKYFYETFYSDKLQFATVIKIPSDLLEFTIYMPTSGIAKYIEFEFNSENFYYPMPDIPEATLQKIFIRHQKFSPYANFIPKRLYELDLKYMNAGGIKPAYVQCILAPDSQKGKLIVSINRII